MCKKDECAEPTVAGWWFGTFFPYIGNVIIPIDELIFFRGVETSTTNQKENLDEYSTTTDYKVVPYSSRSVGL